MADKTNTAEHHVDPARLWFGLAASALAWVGLGCTDILMTWRMCANHDDFGMAPPQPGLRVVYIAIAIILLSLVITAGSMSYRNWRELSSERNVLDADATDRREFMALLGVIVSVTLGMGVIWLSIPPFLIAICERAR